MSQARRASRLAKESPGPQIRERLLQAAHDLISEKGLAGFKVVDVAARARANVAMFDHPFGSRHLLLDEAVRLAAVGVAWVRAERVDSRGSGWSEGVLAPVGGRLGERLQADVAACARPVVDQHLRTEPLSEFGRDDAQRRIGRAARPGR